MKIKLLVATFLFTPVMLMAQVSVIRSPVPAVGIPQPTIRAETPSLSSPQGAIPRPGATMFVGPTPATANLGGGGGLLVGNGSNGGAEHADVNFEPTKPMVSSSSNGMPTPPASYIAIPNLGSSGNAPTVSDSPKVVDGIVQ